MDIYVEVFFLFKHSQKHLQDYTTFFPFAIQVKNVFNFSISF